MPEVPEQQFQARETCEHHWVSHHRHGVSVRVCSLCHDPDLSDVALRGIETSQLRGMLRRVFDGKGIEYDSCGWAVVTMHEDEVEMIQEAIRVH